MRIILVISAASLALSACTFVKMAPGGNEVRVVAQGASMAACEKRGEIDVSVKDRLGPYERDELRVKDELETLARNEAPSVSADTIQPRTSPADGAQRFLAFRCSGAKVVTDSAKDQAETAPLKD